MSIAGIDLCIAMLDSMTYIGSPININNPRLQLDIIRVVRDELELYINIAETYIRSSQQNYDDQRPAGPAED